MSLRSRVAELLAPGGRLARRWPRYEERHEQHALAGGISEMLEHGGVLLAEAPTGLGKSLAYLLPAALLAAEGRRVVIATCTRSLQDQLLERDLPAVLESLELRLPYVRLKGKQNYACPRLLELVEGRGPEENAVLDRLRRWASDDAEGDLDRFESTDAEVFRRLRARVCADPTACTGATCRRGRECFWMRARRQAAQAPLVVVNHALLALSGEVDGLLPEFDALIVDEAHRLEGVLLAQLERSVSRNRFEEALRLVGSGRAGARGAGGLAARLRGYALPLLQGSRLEETAREELDRLVRSVSECRDDVEGLFERLEPGGPAHPVYGARARYRSANELLGSDLKPLEAVLGHCSSLARRLHRLADELNARETGAAALELSVELEQVSMRWATLALDLEHLGDASEPGWVYWRTSGTRGVELHGSPVTAGEHARRLILSRARAAVLTSATLSAGGDFSFVAERLGLGEEWGVPYLVTRHPSPFALERQMQTLVCDVGPDEAAGVASVVARLAAATGRNQLVLFTAHERLRRARERLIELLPEDTVLLAQEWDGPAGLLADRFRGEHGAILLGVQSLWEGVDFPGEALEILVVAKLPFSVPDDPLVEARGQRLKERGLEPFQHDAVPEAVLRFRQGVGRLIRRADDRGVLVVCDRRLVSASYRRPFLEALPGAPRVMREPGALAAAAARFLSGEVAVEDSA
jgi:Rad3-related DNA helicase